ncbi:MAG: hypothetical protein WBP51_02870 [Candidatus Sulfotelmatobacter sp.]
MRVRSVVVAVMLILTLACGGSSKLPVENVSGAYEFVVSSSVTGAVTLVEANLATNGNQSSATGPSQVQILTLEGKTWYVNGVCPGSTPGQNSAVVTSTGNNIGFTFDEGGNATNGQGTLTGTTITGNYSITGSTCANLQGPTGFPPGYDSGGFVGNVVPPLDGTFSGILNLPTGNDNAALTLTENQDSSLNVSAQLTGIDNGTFALTGTAVGNVMFVSGSINGRALSLLGYYDRAGTYTKFTNSLLVFDYDTLTNAGVLVAP